MTQPTEIQRQNRAFWDGFLVGVMFAAAFLGLAYVLAEALR